MPTVSVIIPNYNHAPYLRERIDSVLNQTFQDFEVIILDDKSLDNSKEIIESYRNHPKVKHIVYNDKNSGSTFKQWEKGIGLATGEWIWIAESDDVAEAEFLEILYSKTKNDLHIVLAFSASIEINSKGDKTKKVDWAYDISDRNWNQDYFCNGVDEIKKQFYYKNIIPNASAVLFKKSSVDMSIFKKIQDMKFAGDWFFWVKLAENGDIYYSAKKLNLFRYHQNTTRSTKTFELEKKRFGEYFQVINSIKYTFGVKWYWKNHSWVMDEWINKFCLGGKRQVSFCPYFPIHYNIILLMKILMLKFKKFHFFLL
ncbi:MAG: hypothetical protein BGN96_07380 [Bacteroidales bacterium 45-6]|nr:MAG: hypothetical protein BGN96_07380 [Bacteroidales bacterium 45-6]